MGTRALLLSLAACGTVRQSPAPDAPASADARPSGDAPASVDAPHSSDAPAPIDAPADAPPPAPNLAFVTSTQYTVDTLGGLAGADAACAARATAAGLTGTYVAWLSTSSTNAVTRLGSASGWTRVDGKPFANSAASLTAGTVYYPLDVDELGHSQGLAPVLTATQPDGTVASLTCGNLASTSQSGAIGVAVGGTQTWTAASNTQCTASLHLYCFGTDRTSSVRVTPPQGRRAFVTKASWTPGGGIASADAACAAEATAALLPGAYRAYLHSSAGPAIARFDTSGAPWMRVDGVLLGDLSIAQNSWTAMPDVTADGMYEPSQWVWGRSGASTPTASQVCNDWTSSASTDYGLDSSSGQPNYGSWACNATNHHLLCLQE